MVDGTKYESRKVFNFTRPLSLRKTVEILDGSFFGTVGLTTGVEPTLPTTVGDPRLETLLK